ncbi:MAG: hypothetical protein K6E87_06130 [bacterium]|nr:hypothetical protein [bacterium]
MKKIFIILITCLLFTGCSLNSFVNNRKNNNTIETSYGSYNIPSTWMYRKDHSTSSKYFFTNKNDKKNPPNNISVEMGTNYYSEDNHNEFSDAILRQLGYQITDNGMKVTSSGSTTKNGYIVYTFNIESSAQTTIQHYIIGDYKYVLVHETIWDDNSYDIDNAAKTIVNSFKWKE